MSIHNYEKAFARTLERISESKEISQINKKHIIGFKNNLQSDGIGLAKVNRYLFDLLKFNRLLKKQFDKANKEDLRRVVSEIYNEPLSEETRRCFKIMLRKFYCYLRGFEEKGIYPEEVKWMKMNLNHKHTKLPEELLTEEETKRIIQSCTNIRDKALIAVLAESGCRVSEIGTMQIKHISFEPYGARLAVSGKTGSRKILVVTSTPYLQEWINSHPQNNNPEAFLWIHPKTGLLQYHRITDILKQSAERAGVKKRIHPHLLRHSRATQLASIMSDSQLKNYLGWTQSSRMAGIYVHMSGKDTDDAILNINNIKKDEIKKESLMKPITCIKCKSINPATHRFCKLCGFALDEKSAQEIIESFEKPQNSLRSPLKTLTIDVKLEGYSKSSIVQDNKKKEIDTIMNKLFQDKDILNIIKVKIGEIKA